jgi:mutator protein MutT
MTRDLAHTFRYKNGMTCPLLEVAIAIVHREQHWLVAQRPAAAHLGGLWEFPGGKRRPSESTAAAALRELREECGVEAAVERILDPLICHYDDRSVELTGVVCCWKAGEPVPLASVQCRWVTAAELRALPMPAVNAAIIAAALDPT